MERNHTEACTDLERKREKESVYVQHKFKILTITVHLQVLVIAMTNNLKININFLISILVVFDEIIVTISPLRVSKATALEGPVSSLTLSTLEEG